MNKTKITTQAGGEKFVISRLFNAPKEKVFKAWTEADQIKKWWGPKDFACPSAAIDLRPGGKYLYAMQDLAGKLYWSGGEFKEVDAPNRLKLVDYFTDDKGNKAKPDDYGLDKNFPSESLVTVLFKEERDKTKLSIIYEMPEDIAARQAMVKSGMTEGWNSSLDKLQDLVEN